MWKKWLKLKKANHGPDEMVGESKGGVTATSALETDEQTRPGSQRKLGRPSREPKNIGDGQQGRKKC